MKMIKDEPLELISDNNLCGSDFKTQDSWNVLVELLYYITNINMEYI